MENSLTRWVYNHSLVFMQNIYTTIYGLRKRVQRYSSRQYEEFYGLFSKSRSWSFAELRAYQDERLCDLIETAYEHVPFYRRRFDELKLRPSDVRTVDDLPKLPMLTKQDIRTAGNDMVADNYPRSRAIIAPTSASTGFPLTIWWSQTICAADTLSGRRSGPSAARSSRVR